MRLSTYGALALAVGSATAYLDTSPFFLFSSSPSINLSTPSTSIQQGKALHDELRQILTSCPTSKYLMVTQIGVTTANYTSSTQTPYLASCLSASANDVDNDGRSYRSQITVPEVIGSVRPASLTDTVAQKCNAGNVQELGSSSSDLSSSSMKRSNVITVHLDNSKDLKTNDEYLSRVIAWMGSDDLTVLYATSPDTDTEGVSQTGHEMEIDEEPTQYEMEGSQIIETFQMELKRDLGMHAQQTNGSGNGTVNDGLDGALFDRYQFFTPGIWMGLLVVLILASILYVGLTALSGLSVTYGSFDKETGQLAGKKGQ